MEGSWRCFSSTNGARPAATVTARIVDDRIAGENENCGIQVVVPPGRILGSASGSSCSFSSSSLQLPSSGSGLVQNFVNFKRSGAPSRVMFFRDEAWNDFPEAVVDIIRSGFAAGKTALEVPIDGSSYVFDFLGMSQIDLATGSQMFIAWIDENRKCFFPRSVIGDEKNTICSKLEIEIKIDGKGSAIPSGEPIGRNRTPPYPPREEQEQEQSDESSGISTTASPEIRRLVGAELLDTGDKFYKVMEKLFLTGMRRFDPATRISSIYRCSHVGSSAGSRLKAFQMQMEMTKAARGGAANVRFGWYGTSVEGVNSVLAHGFGQPNHGFLGSDARGVGVYLSPPQSPNTSCLFSEADKSGEKYVILCRAIMGNTEKVGAGSVQFHPSSAEFDSGVDDLENPKWYIVWSTHMNTHILPEYVVGFKTSTNPEGPRRRESLPKRTPSTTFLSFAKLYSEFGNFLSSSRMQALELMYNQYKAGKICRKVFIRNLRSIAGDKLLISIIRRFQNRL